MITVGVNFAILGRGSGMVVSEATAAMFEGSGSKLVIFSQTKSLAFFTES